MSYFYVILCMPLNAQPKLRYHMPIVLVIYIKNHMGKYMCKRRAFIDSIFHFKQKNKV